MVRVECCVGLTVREMPYLIGILCAGVTTIRNACGALRNDRGQQAKDVSIAARTARSPETKKPGQKTDRAIRKSSRKIFVKRDFVVGAIGFEPTTL